MGKDFDQSRRRFLRTTGAGVAAASTVSSTAAATKSDDESKPSNRTLNLQLEHTLHSLDPIQSTNTATSWVLEQVVDGLTTFPDGHINPTAGLATGFEILDDYRTYRFHLDETAVFHDGYGPVTAADVVYSFERLAGSPRSYRKGYIFDLLGVEHERESGEYVPGSIAVDAIDAHTVEIRLQTPFYGALEVLANVTFGIVPEGIVDDVPGYAGELSHSEFSQSPVAAGPFHVTSWIEGEAVSVQRFPKYHGDKPWVGQVHWDILPETDKHERILAGELDLWTIDNAAYDPDLRTEERTTQDGNVFGTYGPMENDRTANFQSVPGQTIYYLGFNCENVPKSVRVALAYLVNQTKILNDIWLGKGVPAAHATPPTLFPGGRMAYDNHASEYPYGLTESRLPEAATAMDAAGYGPENTYSMQFTTFPGPHHRELGDWLTKQASEAYIDLTVEQLGWNDLIPKVWEGNVDAFFLGWAADWPGAENVLQLLYPPYTDTDDPDAVSTFDWDDTPAASTATAAFESILENQGPNEEDESNRRSAYLEIEEANWDDVAMVPLFHNYVERYWYDWVDISPFGGMGPRNQKYTDVTLKPKQSRNGKGGSSGGKGN